MKVNVIPIYPGNVIRVYIMDAADKVAVEVAQDEVETEECHATVDLYYPDAILEEVCGVAEQFTQTNTTPTVHFIRKGEGYTVLVLFRLKNVNEAFLRRLLPSDYFVSSQQLIKVGKIEVVMAAETDFEEERLIKPVFDQFKRDGQLTVAIVREIQPDVAKVLWRTKVNSVSDVFPNLESL